MNVKVHDVMVHHAIVTMPHITVGHVKTVMRRSRIQTIPVVNPKGKPVGIVSASDLLKDVSDGTPVNRVMTQKVFTVPEYADVHVAARVMRNHRIHHLVVTHEGVVSGILSSFDLIGLVENKRFVLKNPPTEKRKKTGRS